MGQASLPCESVEVLLEINDPSLWVNPGAAWDFNNWDEPNSTWVEPEQSGWMNATPYNRGFILERGRQTSWDDLQASKLDFELDNASGVFSVFGSASFPRIRPGLAVHVYAWWDGVRYPIFSGGMTEWNEGHEPGNFTISAKAVDDSRLLADPISIEYHAGYDRQQAGSRIWGLLDRGEYEGQRQIANGLATMTNYLSTRTLLDEIKLTAESDGGIFFFDNDGTAIYMDRNRFFGRPYNKMPVFGDGCNEYELPYAAIEPVLGDQEFGNVIIVTNVSQGTDSPTSGKAVNAESILENGRWMWSPPQLVLCNADHVQGLADFQLERRSTLFYRIDSFECYPIHDDNLWPVLLGLRIGDIVKVIRRPPESEPLNANMLVDGMRIEATPSMWKFVTRCSPGTIVEDVAFWDFNGVWDTSLWV